MRTETVEIYGAKLELFIHDDGKTCPMIVICPGGGYEHVSLREGKPVAMCFFSKGYNCSVLTYTCAPFERFPTQLIQLANSVKHIRINAESLNTDPDKICTMGFSAGGHLTACLGCFWPEYGINAQVNAQILCYPVITAGKFAHKGSFENLCEGNEDLMKMVSLEKMVRPCVPPTFIWHTKPDKSVPVENTLLFDKALTKEKIPHQVLLFETGEHGISLATEEVVHEANPEPNKEVQVWPDKADAWLKKLWK
ncbi:MAG: alpha/beta hydrolase [Sphaerochaetaceae bacterium]|nr:alpha/beta hydrolase [Sphaerochaetaceae bacterium]